MKSEANGGIIRYNHLHSGKPYSEAGHIQIFAHYGDNLLLSA